MRGFATTAAQSSPEGCSGYNVDLTLRYNLEKAKQLMKEAGYENGFTVSMISSTNSLVNDEKIAQAVVALCLRKSIFQSS